MKSENEDWLNFIEDRSTDQKERVDQETETHQSLEQVD